MLLAKDSSHLALGWLLAAVSILLTAFTDPLEKDNHEQTAESNQVLTQNFLRRVQSLTTISSRMRVKANKNGCRDELSKNLARF